ncbi:MAG: OsmC family protein [Rikenellaceae bacterium]|nr:OsmC family protein [Rikenellaceae bacterium]
MATTKTIYTGDLRTEITHLKSDTVIATDAPVDNNGKGETFSPTDLVAAALGSCMLTIMGIAARTHGFDIDGTIIDTTKIMGTDPRRISEIIVDITFPQDYDDKTKRILEAAANSCPVAHSLHPDTKQTIKYTYTK